MKYFNKNTRGFTLIELLVVIAIIGVLASVVLASLNSARNKGQIAAIKSNLKNIIPQAELAYDTPGNYSAVCGSSTDPKVASMLTAITNAGASQNCFTYNNSGYSDVYLRWGVSAIKGTSTPIQAYSVSGTGVVTWDVQGVNTSGTFVTPDVTMTWAQANTACSTASGRLPTLEELQTLSLASYAASTSYTPPGFNTGGAGEYWSGTNVPSNPTRAYIVFIAGGSRGTYDKNSSLSHTRCVR